MTQEQQNFTASETVMDELVEIHMRKMELKNAQAELSKAWMDGATDTGPRNLEIREEIQYLDERREALHRAEQDGYGYQK